MKATNWFGIPMLRLTSIMLSGATLACGSDVAAPHNAGDQVFLRLVVDKRAIVISAIAPHNTIQLSATAFRGDGTPIANVPVTFEASDNNLLVTSDGLVTAQRAGNQSRIIIRAQYQGVTRADTAFFRITNTRDPAPVRTFSIQLDPNAPSLAGTTTSIRPTAIDTNGVAITGTIPVDYQSSESLIADVTRQGVISWLRPEQEVLIRAATTIYGVTKTDSVRASIGYPNLVQVGTALRANASGQKVLAFVPDVIYLTAGGTLLVINWQHTVGFHTIPIDVVFEDPLIAEPDTTSGLPTGSGNIAPFKADSNDYTSAIRTRKITKAGTFKFRSALYGTTGTIHVR